MPELRSVLRGSLGPPGDCALLMYRNNANVGDAAIWVAATRALKTLGFSIRYSATRDQADLEELRSVLPRGPIFISGGGSLGTSYPRTHAHKEDVITAFPERKIVILPQSGQFADGAALESFGSVVASHENLTVLCRDTTTLETLAPLDVETALCPDLVTGLHDHPAFARGRRTKRTEDCVLLLRTDGEAPGSHSPSAGVDWSDPSGFLLGSAMRNLSRVAARTGPGAPRLWAQTEKAEIRLRRGVSLLSPARALVTDRLHGMVFAQLLETPCYALDNSWGKVRAFHDTWADSMPHVQLCESLEEATHRALEHAAR